MHGYYRSPTIHKDLIVFVCEDDLWTIPRAGGVARRLTTSIGAFNYPCLSPDGEWLACTGREEGAWEVEVMPACGGESRRLTFQGALAETVGWTPDGKYILYSSEAGMPFSKARRLWKVRPEGGEPELLPVGVANRMAFGPKGLTVLGRHAGEPARWKRYRGGTAGQLWVDRHGKGDFERLAPVDGNITAPMILGGRIYFIADHEGIGNLYSCTLDGNDVRRQSHHEGYYVRGAKTDGRSIVYHAGADLYLLDARKKTSTRIEVSFHSPRAQLRRKYVDAARYLQEFTLHPKGNALAVIARGKLFSLHNWEGPVLQHGEADGVRYRLAEFLNDGKRLVAVSDSGGEESLEVLDLAECRPLDRLQHLDIGRPTGLAVCPAKDKDFVALRNHRFELHLVDLKSRESRMVDHSEFGDFAGFAWSPDGRYLAYSYADSQRTRILRVFDTANLEVHDLTPPEFDDLAPAWDPEGKFLYFLSSRTFNPVYDALHFELSFPKAMRPMLVLLQRDAPNPFVPVAGAEPPAEPEQDKDKEKEKEASVPEVRIDWENISRRVLAFPAAEGRYGQISGIKGKALYTSFPVDGSLPTRLEKDEDPKGSLLCYDFKLLKEESLLTGITGFTLSRDHTTLLYSGGKKLRVLKAGEKPPENKDKPRSNDGGRSSGWIDLARVKVAVSPGAEWRQMYRESWRLQRDHFWTQDMSGVNWEEVYLRYLPLLDRIATRGEFSDLMWEMQGELGTSHAYEMGGDYRLAPNLAHGFLGADFLVEGEHGGYRIDVIVRGDSWDDAARSPLLAPGANLAEGDTLLAINGRELSPALPPSQFLVNLANQEVELLVRGGNDAVPRRIVVKTLGSETALRYRAWVNENRARVHEQSRGAIGYIHIPDMMAAGFAEFHRGWLPELRFPALLIDVRYNAGGHVSQLLLEKLARRRLGYDVMRWGPPMPYPYESLLGPMLALTNENAGSDGDMFSHCFKLMKLGPLIGTRTWGGVIGIDRKQFMVDGGLTTQPEYAFWFEDVGWKLENYGTEPDVVVDISPQDYRDGKDPQLDTAIEMLMETMKDFPPRLPDFGERPRFQLPKLPFPEA